MVLDKITRFLKRKRKRPKRRVPREHESGWLEYYPGSYEDFKRGIEPERYTIDHSVLKDYYESSEWVRACVDAIVKEITAKGWELYSTDEDDPQPRKIERLTNWFETINPDKSLDDLIKVTLVDWLVTGDGYWEIVPNKLGIPVFAYILDPKTIRIKVNKHGGKTGYLQVVEGNQQNFKVRDVLHWVYQPRSDSAYGIAPLETLIQTAAGDLTARDYNNVFFKNSASPRLHIDLGEGATRDTLEWYVEWWKKNMQKKPHRNIFTVGNATVDSVAPTNKDAEFIEFMQMNASKIMAVYGVPPIILGLTDKSGKYSAPEQRIIWKENRIRPLQREFAKNINKLIDRFGKNYKTIRFRFKDLDSPNPMEVMQLRVLQLKHGLRTINEIREEDGLQPVEWGDEPLLLQTKGSPGSEGQEGLEVHQEPDKERDVNVNAD